MKTILLLLAIAIAPVCAETLPLYSSDFEKGIAGWEGRAGYGKSKPQIKTSVENPKEPGKFYAWVLTDGQLGCGFNLKANLPCETDKEYLVTFWFKSRTGLSASYHISAAEGNGEPSGAWHPIPKLENEWVRVEYAFVATKSPIGLEIGVNGKDYEPSEIYLYDVRITPN